MLRAVLTGASLLLAAIVPCDALAAACPSTHSVGTTVVPNVARLPLNAALATLLARHLRVSIPHIIPFEQAMAEQGRGRLENYDVIAQSPRAGTKVADGRTIVLVLSDPNRQAKMPLGSRSIVVPTDHPGSVRVPNLIGMRYHAAMAAGHALTTGVWVRIGRTRSLSAAASTCGLDGLTVATQTPAPGTLVPWQGVAASGVTPSLATVTIGLVSKA
jgi:beta-lactam-binding protein with PASTA domain